MTNSTKTVAHLQPSDTDRLHRTRLPRIPLHSTYQDDGGDKSRWRLQNVRFHDLRHSTASILYDKGWALKDIQEWPVYLTA